MKPVTEEMFAKECSSLTDTINDQMKEIAELSGKLEIAEEALVWCSGMLRARDEMNSKVHCAPVRYSTITELVDEALKKIRGG